MTLKKGEKKRRKRKTCKEQDRKNANAQKEEKNNCPITIVLRRRAKLTTLRREGEKINRLLDNFHHTEWVRRKGK